MRFPGLLEWLFRMLLDINNRLRYSNRIATRNDDLRLYFATEFATQLAKLTPKARCWNHMVLQHSRALAQPVALVHLSRD